MKLIKIIQESIRKNPNAGRTIVYGPEQVEMLFEYPEAKLPEKYLNHPYIIEVTWDINKVTGIIVHPDMVNELAENGFKVTINSDRETIHQMPEPAYFYKYENVPIQCLNCGEVTLRKEIRSAEIGDFYGMQCPHCGEINDFEPVQYQELSDIINPAI